MAYRESRRYSVVGSIVLKANCLKSTRASLGLNKPGQYVIALTPLSICLSLVVTMILLPPPNEYCCPSNVSIWAISSTSSRTSRIFFSPRFSIIKLEPLFKVPTLCTFFVKNLDRSSFRICVSPFFVKPSFTFSRKQWYSN